VKGDDMEMEVEVIERKGKDYLVVTKRYELEHRDLGVFHKNGIHVCRDVLVYEGQEFIVDTDLKLIVSEHNPRLARLQEVKRAAKNIVR
jgi:hypothetical protein